MSNIFRSDRYRQAREKAGLNYKEVAERLGLSAVNLPGMWERGDREPSLDKLAELAKLLGVSTDYLLGLDDAPEREPGSGKRTRSRAEVLANPMSPAGLQALAEDTDLCSALRIEPDEWEALSLCDHRGGLTKLGQVALLALLRDCSIDSRRALVLRKGGRPLKDSTLAEPAG